MPFDIAISLFVGISVMALTWRLFFSSVEQFNECIGYWFKPDLFSWADGSLFEDIVGSFRFQIWLVLGIASGYGVYWAITN